MRILLAALLLTSLAPAQEDFKDSAYKFSLQIPAGMQMLTDEGRALRLDIPLEQAVNKPRQGSETLRLEHHHVWIEADDEQLYNREIDLRLVDQIPFQGPDHFVEWLEEQGIEVLGREKIGYPVGPALLIDGVFTGPDGLRSRQYVLFVARLQRWAMLILRANEGDFAIVEPEFRAVIQSIEFRQPLAPKPPSVFDEPQGGAGLLSASWASLEVAGSLVLAAILILMMVLGGRKVA
jgi:hypothetical protein